MLRSTEQIIGHGLRDKIFTASDLCEVFTGSFASRNATISETLKKGELVKIVRGVYVLEDKIRSYKVSEFSVANKIVPGSFVSSLSALVYHKWIPKKIETITSVFSGQNGSGTRNFYVPGIGEFSHDPIQTRKDGQVDGVRNVTVGNNEFLMATPLRALVDYAFINKINFTSISFLTNGIGVDAEKLKSLTEEDFNEISCTYKSKKAIMFLEALGSELGLS